MKTGFVKILFSAALLTAAVTAQIKEPADFITFGNADENPSAGNTLARAGETVITAKEFLYGYEFGPAFVKRKPDSKKKYLDYLINEKLLANDGYKRGLQNNREFIEYYSAIKADLVSDELYKKEILKNVNVAESEIEKGAGQSLITLSVKWLYSPESEGIKEYQKKMREGIGFDSLFNGQINDAVFMDMRSMEIDRFSLGKKNPLLAGIIDSMKPGDVSLPVHTPDGWYIVKVDNLWRSVLPSESEMNKIEYDVRMALYKAKADSAAEVYSRALIAKNEPVIKKKTLMALRSYIGKYALPEEKYKEWGLAEKLAALIDSLKLKDKEEAARLPLVEMKSGVITISDFLKWFSFRSENIKLDKNTLKSFSVSLENLVWRMLRDELFVKTAYAQKLDENKTVIEQSAWWKDKIMFAVVRDEIGRSVTVADEIKTGKPEKEKKEEEFTKKMFHKINALKREAKVEIDEKLLGRIKVDQENDQNAIEVYTAKTGGYFPRQAFPSIDLYWRSWE
jgi:hypothetical protein